ncbi:MAG TPA: hypothetical protein VJ875_21835, partial [Pyrinomonadaceae bacterium]|nr:hypothetical protein [Pyrinomonadaceae bacterium]
TPDVLSVPKQRMLAIFCALLAGLVGFFLTGDISVNLVSPDNRLGKLAVKATGGIAMFAFVLVWWLTPWSPVIPDVYRVTVTVTDSQKKPVADARVTSSLGENGKQQGSVWQFDIPTSAKPADGKVTFFAEKKVEYLSGRGEIVLSNDFNPTLTIEMARDTTAKAMAVVVDAADSKVDGAEVWIEHHEEEKTKTAKGRFELPAHGAPGERVMVVVSRPNLPVEKHWLIAGDTNGQITLSK